MTLYLVRQRRPYWICLIQAVEANSPEEAEDKFYDEFDPECRVVERQLQRVEHGPVQVFEAAEFAAKEDCALVD